jgi:hypothetical protein
LFGARVKGGEDLATLLEVALEFATETGRRCFFPDDIPVLVPECLVELARVPQLEQGVKIVSEESDFSSGAVYEGS